MHDTKTPLQLALSAVTMLWRVSEKSDGYGYPKPGIIW